MVACGQQLRDEQNAHAFSMCAHAQRNDAGTPSIMCVMRGRMERRPRESTKRSLQLERASSDPA